METCLEMLLKTKKELNKRRKDGETFGIWSEIMRITEFTKFNAAFYILIRLSLTLRSYSHIFKFKSRPSRVLDSIEKCTSSYLLNRYFLFS